MKYADPTRCPGCRAHLPTGTDRCPHCNLAVRHPLAQQVFATLTRADELVARLRAEQTPPLGPVPTIPPPPPAVGPPAPVAPPPLVAPPSLVEPVETRPSVLSVPKVLLGLGALCLLVAAVIFLAVSWSWLGIGGRTTVLVGLTAASGALAAAALRQDLRIAAEALSGVCLGLLALDVSGAESAGWLGELSGSGLAVAVGLVVVAAGTAFAHLTTPALGTPQVAAAIGALTAYAGVLASTSHEPVTGHVALVVVVGAIVAARRIDLTLLASGLAVVGGVIWSITVLAAVGTGAGDLTLRGFWLEDGTGWSLVASGCALLVPGALLGRGSLAVAGGGAAAVLATLALTAPAIDEPARTLAVAALVATAAWAVATGLLPARLRVVGVIPSAVGSLVLGGLVIVTGAVATWRWAEVGGPFTVAADARLGGLDPVTEPLLAAPAVAVMAGALAGARVLRRSARTWLTHAGLATGTAALATLASYDVPLALVAGAAGLLALAALAVSLTAASDRDRTGVGALAVLLAAGGVVVALPSATLTAITAAGALAITAALHLLGTTAMARLLGGLALAPASGLVLVATADAWSVDPAEVGVAVVLLAGVLAIVRPRPEVEVPAAVVAVLATAYAVPAATDLGAVLALHLTAAGAVVVATGLLHRGRRPAIGAGLALLVLASWVRLGDLGVTAPEPYTLPLGLALTGAGLWRLRSEPAAGTLPSLLPGLGLATVPTLLWVLVNPVSLRALLLGAACAALVIGGGALRWNAPLVVGASVGAVLALRELAPYAAVVPQWIWIGLAGTLLTVVGVTWERRLHEVRAAAGHLGRLR